MFPFIDPVIFAALGFMITWLVVTLALKLLCKLFMGSTSDGRARRSRRSYHYHY